jgi:hypothetical protein
MKFELNRVHPNPLPGAYPAAQTAEAVSAEAHLEGDFLCVDFSVRSRAFFSTASLSTDRSHWGLWDEGDVVELFLAARTDIATVGYFEFQLSPRGQFFTLQVLEPRVRWDSERAMPFEHSVTLLEDEGVWRAQMKIPLHSYGWTGRPQDITGGLFAILGPKAARTYWAAFLPAQKTPDYHLPEFFRPLLIEPLSSGMDR